jgi:hypothetical protein
MFHTAAFWESIDHAGALGEIAAAAGEQVLFVTGDDIRVPDDVSQLVAAAPVLALGANEGRLVSPSLRRIVNPQLVPINSLTDGNVEPQTPHVVHDWRRNPIPLSPGESLNALCDCNSTAAADQSIVVWLADGPITPVEGVPIYPVRCTGAATLVAGAWTNGALTFAQDLPSGRYAVVGFRAQGATLVAARLVFRGGSARPGVLGTDVESDDDWAGFRYGQFGIFGEFDANTPPTFDALANDADTAQEFVLDLTPLGV